MDRNFSTYLIYIVIVAVVLISLLIFSRKKTKINKKKNYQPERILAGNLSVFFDPDENVTIIPYIKDKYGMGRATAQVLMFTAPYSAERLGKAVRKAMNGCLTGTPCNNAELMAILEFNDWKDFSKGKRNISVHYNEQHGVVFNTTRRKADGSYHFNSLGLECTLPPDTRDRELGDALIGLLKRCRC